MQIPFRGTGSYQMRIGAGGSGGKRDCEERLAGLELARLEPPEAQITQALELEN
jgi:hypothetical protein